MTTRRGQTSLALVAILTVPLLAACGGDGAGDGDNTTIPTEPSVAAEDPATDDQGDTEQPPAAPAEYTGSITYAGETVELSSEDFYICETVNPAFEGDFNISTDLSDGTRFRLSGNLDSYRDDESEGAFLGQIPEEERVEGLELELDQRTLSGHGTGSGGAIEFTFTC